jgi:hypothetical protein
VGVLVSGRHRESSADAPRRFPIGVVAAGTVLAVLAGAAGWVVARGREPCRPVRLAVVAAPDVVPVVTGVAGRFNRAEARRQGDCAQVTVRREESSATASDLARAAAKSAGGAADAWIPDSSIWVDRVRSSARHPALAGEPVSVATSPVVIALTRPVAARVGGLATLGWGRLLQELRSGQPLQIGFPNPVRHTTGLAALLAAANIAQASPRARAQQVALTRALSEGEADEIPDLVARLPRRADEVASSLAGLPATEQAVWRYNTSRPAVPLVAVYPAEGALLLDYPYVRISSGDDQRKARAGDRLLAALQQPSARDGLLNAGFRAPDGTAGDALTPRLGVSPRMPKTVPTPPAPVVAAAIRSWQELTLPARMLVLIDTSGSMGQIIPGINRSRIEVTVAAAQEGLGLLGDDTEMGVWEFAAGLVGRSQDYRLLVPPGPLSQPVGDVPRRAALAGALTRLRATNDWTGLYDSVLAVYRIARAGYQPSKINSVLVLTDGKNQDPAGGASLPQLLTEITKLADLRRPVPVFMLLFGPDADMASARKIAQATSGGAYHVNTPGEITQVFLDAVGQRTCRPHC